MRCTVFGDKSCAKNQLALFYATRSPPTMNTIQTQMQPEAAAEMAREVATAAHRFRITEDEYVQAMRLHARKLPWWRLLAVLCCFAVLIAIAAVMHSPMREMGIGGIIAAVVIIVLNHTVVLPWLARRHYRAYKQMQQTFTLEQRESGLYFTSEQSQALVQWSQLLKWCESDTLLLLYVSPVIFHILPSQQLQTSGLDWNRLRQALLQHVGRAK